MTAPPPATPVFYRPDEVAAILRCSTWWVKDQARHRRIPYCWIGGGYRFTPEHLTEIARRCEVRPADTPDPVNPVRAAPHRPAVGLDADAPSVLVARVPRRLRRADAADDPAA